ncbi:MAG: peroxidase-related enzyme [Deltaproteobacteria bacterium]|nr:peroxidase-related enzyme [Deltaproteobacteria bacterium]
MAWIRTVPPEKADGELAEFYRQIRSARGALADVHQVQSLNPRALRAHFDLYKAIVFQRSSLSRPARERIAVVVSAANRCPYCVAHHGEALRQLDEREAIVEALGRGEIPADLAPADAGLLRWAGRAAHDPAGAAKSDLGALRGLGFDDRAILDAVLTVAYFSFVNRIVLLLGVGLETDFARSCGTTPEEAAGAGKEGCGGKAGTT